MAFDPDKYLNEKQASSSPSFDPDAYLASNKQNSTPKSKGLLDYGKDAIDYGIRGLDYLGGAVRTGLASGADAFVPGNNITKEDWINTLKGKAPSSDKLLEKLGVPEGPSLPQFKNDSGLSMYGLAKGGNPEEKEIDLSIQKGPSVRGALGFAADIATDPLTYVGFPGKRIAGEATEALGKKIYKSGFKKVDEKLIEGGARPLSEGLLERGVWGNNKEIAEKVKGFSKEAANKRSGLYKKAEDLGAKVDLNEATKNADVVINKMAQDPGLAPTAESLRELINRYKQKGVASLQDVSDWKTNLYNSLPSSAFGPNGRLTGPAKEVQNALAEGFKNSIVTSAEKSKAGLGKEIDALNKEWGSFIGAQKPLEKEIRKESTKNLVSSIDAGLLGFMASNAISPQVLIAKKLGDLSKTTKFRTGAGLGLIKAGQSGVIDPLLRRGLIDVNRNE